MPAAATEDLFPRGHARGQQRYFKKRAKTDGGDVEGLEGVQSGSREPERARRRKLTPGSTVLAVVTRCDESAVYFELPSGTRARADPMETPCEGGASYFVDAVAAATNDDDNSDMDDGEEKEDIPLHKVLHVGQVVRAAIISGSDASHAGTKQLQVSLKPALINSRLNAGMLRVEGTHLYGAVKSVEDHGYVLDFGPIPTTGFLPFSDAPSTVTKLKKNDADKYHGSDDSDEDENDDAKVLLPGTPLEVVVSQSQKSLEKKKNKQSKVGTSVLSTVRCSAVSGTVSKAESLMYEGLTFFELCAGMRVAAKVLAVSAARVTATVFGLFTVIIDSVHVPVDIEGQLDVKVGASITVRLLSVDPNQKIITASLLQDVVDEFRIPQIDDKCRIGTIVRNLEVDRIESNFGLYLKKYEDAVQSDDNDDNNDDGNDTPDLTNVPLFAHISRVSEKRIDSLEKLYHIGKKLILDARIVSISKFDGVINVDLRPRIIKRAALDLNEVKPGTCYNCKVLSHLSSGNLLVAVDGDPNITGIIPKLHISDTFISPKTLSRHPTLRSGGVVKCVALSKNEERGALFLSAKKSLVNSTDPLLLGYKHAEEAIKKQDTARKNKKDVPSFVGTVLRVFETLMLVQFCNMTLGSVHFTDLGLEEQGPKAEAGSGNKKKKKRKRTTPEQKVVTRTQEEIEELYPAGSTVRVHLVRMDYGGKGKRRLILSMNGWPVGPQSTEIPSGPTPGGFFQGTVRRVDPARGITVLVPKEYRPKKINNIETGFVGLYDVADDFDQVEGLVAKIKKNQSIQVRIVERKSGNNNDLCLTLRESDSGSKAKDPLRTPQDLPLEAGSQVRGFIHSVTKFGAFVDIGRDVRARIKLSNLSDEYLQNPEKSFPRGTLVSGKIVADDSNSKKKARVEMSLRTKAKRERKAKVTEFKEGDVVKGTVSRVERFGAIIKLSTGGSALLHMNEAGDERVVKNPHDEWTAGQELTAVVIESKAKGVKVSLKRSFFEATGMETDEVDQIIQNNLQGGPNEIEAPAKKKARAEGSNLVQQALDVESDNDDVEMADEEMEEADDSDSEEESEEEKDDVPVLNITHSFAVMDEDEKENESGGEEVNNNDEKDDEKNDGEEKEEPEFRKKKSNKEKKAKKREKEAAQLEIEKKEEALASNTHGPETAEDFERMLLAEPNSSAVWIRYMAFRLSLKQEDLARSVAEKALERIVVEKEVERVNMWMAYINLEASLNSNNTDTVKAAAIFRVFDRAIKRITDVEDFYLQVFTSLKTSAPAVADEIMKRGLRAFRESKDIWMAAGRAKYEKGELNAARKTLENALRALEKKYHVPTIMKYSLFEYKYGSPERGRTNFESLVGNFPKRLDIWNVFLDTEISLCRNGNNEAVEETRLKFERCAQLALSTKKMKSVFKKWLQFEKAFGDDASHRDVLNRAKAYVEGKSGGTE